jgi:hypothetical protein
MEEAGVRFLSIDPGEMDTRMHAEAMPEADPSTLSRPEEVAVYVRSIVRTAERYPAGSRLIASTVEAA